MADEVIGRAYIEIHPRSAGFGPALQREVGDAADKATKTLTQKFEAAGNKLSDVGKKMSRNFTLPIVAGLGFATKAASDLSEQQNKVNVVFGSSATKVAAFAKTASTSLGQSQRAALEAAGTYGNLFRAIGLTEDKSADMSVALLTLTADLASFNNASPDEVFEALRAGLVGETEPLRKFGINLNDARLRAEALKLGLSDGKSVLDAASKAQASYSLILQDSTLAQGDFARTSDGLANQMRSLKGRLEDTAATAGEALIPAMLSLVGAADAVLGAFTSLGPELQQFAVFGAVAVAAIGPMAALAGNAAKAVRGLATAFLFLGSSSSLAFAGALGGIAIGIGGIALAARAFNSQQAQLMQALTNDRGPAVNAAAAFGQTADATDKLRFAVDAYVTGSATAHFAQNLGTSSAEAKIFNEQIDKASLVLKEMTKESPLTAARLVELADSLGLNLGALDDAGRKQFADAAAAIASIQTPAEQSATAVGILGDAASTAGEQFQAFGLVLDSTLGAELDLRNANIAFERALQALNNSLEQNGTNFDISTEAGRKNQEAANAFLPIIAKQIESFTTQGVITGDAAAQLNAYKDKLLQVGGTMQGSRTAFAPFLAQLDAAATAAGLAKDEAGNYVAVLDTIPATAPTDIELNNVPKALSDIGAINGALGRLPASKTVTVRVVTAGERGLLGTSGFQQFGGRLGYDLPHAQSGLRLPGSALVGEVRPEVFAPSRPGRIFSNQADGFAELAALLRENRPVSVTVNESADAQATARAVSRRIAGNVHL